MQDQVLNTVRIRNWHRRSSIFVSVFMLMIAVSGIALQIEMDFISPARMVRPSTAPAQPVPMPIEQLTANVVAGVRRQSEGRIADLAIRTTDSPPTAEVLVLEPAPRRMRLNAITGDPASGADDGLHRLLLEFHRGVLFGRIGFWLSIACGLVLTFLSVSGVYMYAQMLRRRVNAGRRAWVW